MTAEPVSIYIHIPFCRARCSYCAFNTYAGLEHLLDPCLAALRREIALVGAGAAPGTAAQTLYFGGGTPSLLAPEQVAALVDAVRASLNLQVGAEITLEANPCSLDDGKLAGYYEAGVNRLSLGVQSAHDRELRLFGRRHTFAEAAAAFTAARHAGFGSISVDLIYGAPGQSRAGWRQTLRAVLGWQPDHVSIYSLTVEPGTVLHRRIERGELPAPDPDQAADMLEDACDVLADAGLVRYEISNWARPGHESQHNRQYWLNRPFLGFGAGAHGAAAGLRYWLVSPIPEYIARIEQGGQTAFPLSPAVEGFEVIDRQLEMAETVILGLRLVGEGISKAAFRRRFGQDFDDVFGETVAALIPPGLLTDEGGVVRLTGKGCLLSNQVFMRLLPDEA